MSVIAIKRGWLDGDLTEQLRTACYQAVSSDFEKQNLASMFTADGGTDLQETAKEILSLFWRSPLPRTFESIHKERCAVWLDFTTMRYHRARETASHVGWHFDYNFFGNYKQCLVAWVPLDPVGEDAPGLEFCLPKEDLSPQAYSRILQNGKMPGTLTDIDVDTLFGPDNKELVQPKMGPTDTALFSSLILHRTQPMAVPPASRLAIEFRMVSAINPPGRQENEAEGIYSVLTSDGRPAVCRYRDLQTFH